LLRPPALGVAEAACLPGRARAFRRTHPGSAFTPRKPCG